MSKDRLLTIIDKLEAIKRVVDKKIEFKEDLYEIYIEAQDAKTARIKDEQHREELREAVEQVHEQCQERIKGILKLLPEIPVRYDHNATCFDCVSNVKLQALKEGIKE